MVLVLGVEPVWVSCTKDERRGVDRSLRLGGSQDSVEVLGVKGRAGQPACSTLNQLPGALLGEDPEENDAHECVFGREPGRVESVDHLPDEKLGDSVRCAEGVAELIA